MPDNLTGLDPADGSLVQIVSDPSYQLDSPAALAFDGAGART